jgi:sigma-B regulation protein RsbU (phosphoserine phosphatase)
MTALPPSTTPDATRLMAELQFLAELSAVVASTAEFKTIIDWIVQKTTALMGAEEGSIKLLGDEPAPTLHTMIRVRRQEDSDPLDFAISTSVTGWILLRGEPLVSADLLSDPRFPGLRNSKGRVRSILAVPLKVGNRVTGILAVTLRSPGREWSPSHVQLLSICATHSAAVIENARLREIEDEKHRMDQELQIALKTQISLVPSQPLRSGPWTVDGLVIPAKGVGGDYFDYFALGPERFAMAIADVSGKGMPAALLMSNVQAALRAHADGRKPASEVMRCVNAQVARSGSHGKFVTAFYAELDHARGTLTYCNAGHNFPLIRRADRTLVQLEVGGLLLGIMEEASYDEAQLPIHPGDALLLYTDGVSEACDQNGAMFGDPRVADYWRGAAGQTPRRALERLVHEVEAYRGEAAQNDDITAVVASAD